MTKPTEYRTIARKMKNQGMSLRNIAKYLEVSLTAVHTWVTKEPVVRQSTIARLERKQAVTGCIGDNPDFSIRDIAGFCNSSVTSVYRTLKHDLGYSKKKVYQVGTRDNNKIESQRKAFSTSFKKIYQKDVISIDETCLYDSTAPTRRWSLKGTRNYVPIQRLNTTRYSLITATTSTGLLGYKLVKGSVNKEIFEGFVDDLSTEGYRYLLMDNVGFHKSKDVVEKMKSKNVLPLFTSPYSPEWNPAEMYFSYLKRYLRKLYHKRLSCLPEIIEFMNDGIKKSIFKGWFQHVWRAIKSCKHRN